MEELEAIENNIQEIDRLRKLLISEIGETAFYKITDDLRTVLVENKIHRSPAVAKDLFQLVLKVMFFNHYLSLSMDSTLK